MKTSKQDETRQDMTYTRRSRDLGCVDFFNAIRDLKNLVLSWYRTTLVSISEYSLKY